MYYYINKLQQYAGIYLLQNHSHVSVCPSHPSAGVHKMYLQPLVHMYQRLQLQFYVLMMGAMDTRNM